MFVCSTIMLGKQSKSYLWFSLQAFRVQERASSLSLLQFFIFYSQMNSTVFKYLGRLAFEPCLHRPATSPLFHLSSLKHLVGVMFIPTL